MSRVQYARVDEKGNIVLPPDAARRLGVFPGDEVRVEPNGSGVILRSPLTTLKRVYLEITNRCNLNCSTCMRNVWGVNYGNMTMNVFERVLASLKDLSPKPEIFFGGYGEPLSHPNCLEMIGKAKQAGHPVSLISNGILLTEKTTQTLIDLRLDKLWVSLDGASSECYMDVRLGDSLPLIIENLNRLRMQKY
ncbi:MAG: radical SAM protein, partial [Chloroflexi bacterium]|nr:radical SAM protein [Chloroflexota bacterium]